MSAADDAINERLAKKSAWVTGEHDEDGCVEILATQIPMRRYGAHLTACLADKAIDQDDDPQEGALRYECSESLDKLKTRFPEITDVYVVVNAGSTEIGSGGGVAMYEHLLDYAARRGYAVAPHRCVPKGSTSVDAEHVWAALRRRGYPHEGDVFWGKR